MFVDLEEKILEKAKHGSETDLTKVLDTYKGFVYLKAKDFFIVGADKEDVVQEGMIGLLKAIRSYDKNKITSFKNFANLCIKRQIITAIKRSQCRKNMASNNTLDISSFISLEESANLQAKSFSYLYTNPEDMCMSKEDIKSLSSFLKINLSEFEQEVFDYLIKGLDYRDIAKKMDKKLKAVDNAIQRIRRKSEIWLSNNI